MAIAVQANLVQLSVAGVKRRASKSGERLLDVPLPGAVRAFRETLIDRHVIQDYGELELRVRLQEVWGQYCAMAWLFERDPSRRAVDFAKLPPDANLRCDAEIEIKQAEVHAFLWRLRFEQCRRHDVGYASSPVFRKDNALAEKIPVVVFGKKAGEADDDELLAGACQHAGMLAVLRWTMDCDRSWGEPGIMDVGESPF